MAVKVGVLVSGGGTNLQALIDAKNAGQLPAVELALVVSDRPGAYALERAKAAGIQTALVERGAGLGEELLRVLHAAGVQVVVLAGFLSILPPSVIRAYPDRILNVHPSLIPAFSGNGWYGLKVHQAVLEQGVKVTGATVHLVNEVTDGGRILAQKAVEVAGCTSPEQLQRRVMEQAEWQILPEQTQLLCGQIESAQTDGARVLAAGGAQAEGAAIPAQESAGNR